MSGGSPYPHTAQSQVFTSWASAIVNRDSDRLLPHAEQLATKALSLSRGGLRDRAMNSQVLSNIYERMGQIVKAIEALETAISANRKLRDQRRVRQQTKRLNNLKALAESGDGTASAAPESAPGAAEEVPRDPVAPEESAELDGGTATGAK